MAQEHHRVLTDRVETVGAEGESFRPGGYSKAVRSTVDYAANDGARDVEDHEAGLEPAELVLEVADVFRA